MDGDNGAPCDLSGNADQRQRRAGHPNALAIHPDIISPAIDWQALLSEVFDRKGNPLQICYTTLTEQAVLYAKIEVTARIR
jgi:hypothetical protein